MTEVSTLRGVILRTLDRGRAFRIGLGLLEDEEADDRLTEIDRAFLTRWLAFADNSIWSEILAAVDAAPVLAHCTFPFLVRFALRINREAEAGRFGKDAVLEARQERRSRLLELANYADKLARFFREQAKIADRPAQYEEDFRPLSELIAFNDAQARFLRKEAGPEPRSTIKPPRQDLRKGRTGLRKRRLFISSISGCLTRFYDQKVDSPFHIDSLVAFARIEFPEVDYVTVKKALEPTTREGRRQRRRPELAKNPPPVERRP